jgi:DNA repair photolyase
VFVRWDDLAVEKDEQRRLPKLGDEAVMRTFDAPEALGVRFHEIRARSALNRVAKSSRMPFRWTVNPYRGCTHACVYCLDGGTPVLMGDGRTRPLQELRPGDEIYGTAREGRYRRYALTRVLAHWETVKPAFAITLEDGRRLVASGDHRFLTRRGWKYVIGTEHGPSRRPHLTLNDRLLGTGSFADDAGDSATTGAVLTRERSIAGTAVETAVSTAIASIEPILNEMPLYDITTGTGDFIANGVVSHNCFARPSHKYLDLDAGRDFEREIIVKVNAPELLRSELSRPSWKRELVALGTNTDPYQWVESRYKLMPGIWEAIRDSGTPSSLVTKSPLVLRDVELLQEINERSAMTVYLSVPTLDEKAWRETEPHTPSPRARLEAVGELNRSGVPAGILIAPLIPGVNDSPEQVKEIIALATKNGAVSAASVTLHLRGEVRDIFFSWLRHHRPDLLPMYEQIYSKGAYASADLRREHSALVKYRSRRRRRGTKRAGEAPGDQGEGTQATLFK